ncbi:hypothetical protein [Clostridium sp. D33t1_170424_F3]|uniref:hypothetical protein n=1 Tax=Clostridium sp. D33t1_170424_F3 TaxID=2787099 RepID=UPI0018A8AB74|nr:hypothetical protein [Clostridium sp. D33t1_170424_F3]
MNRRNVLFAYIALALVVFGISWQLPSVNKIPLTRSSQGVTVRYLRSSVPLPAYQSEMAYLTEEKAFQKYASPAFKGTIVRIRDIEVDFNGEKEYYSIAKIRVDEPFTGDLAQGKQITVLLPRPIYLDTWVEGTEVISAFRIGMKGIFIPNILYDEDASWHENGETLYLSELADCSLGGGNYGVFLETHKGLLFNQNTYATLSPKCTLAQAELYVKACLNRYAQP